MTMTENGAVSTTARDLLRHIAAGDPAAPTADWSSWGALDDDVDPITVCQFLFLAAFAEGREPFAHSVELKNLKPGDWKLPEGNRVVRGAHSSRNRAVYAVGADWSLFVQRYYNGTGVVIASAAEPELAERTARRAAKLVRRKVKPDEERIKFGFWHAGARGAVHQERAIEAPEWPALRANYAAGVAGQLERLMAVGAEEVNGKLILLHGPPGTGKTTALRALGRAWRAWCRTDCVLDPERLLGEPGYLLEVVMGQDAGDRRWRLLILEDCDELIRGEAKHTAGQALSRLLNLTDGMLGQGQRILVAITTNEPLDRLHPAVVRPGRCLAQIEIGPLSPEEATQWLGTGHRVPRPATLAELYALKAGRDGAEPAALGPEPSTGQYL
ncbi:MAG TPA: DUF5925 domain-containing protein [Actinospica sp.]|jgi:hypothetical protein|nr:DUF5925 domain-containing protein [Actinospica sp.]